jgi:four helix bundle protein
MDLAVAAHRSAGLLPAFQRFELGSQIRKAASSVPSNVAEGHAHRGNRTYLRHVRIALGSLAELETQFELALRLQLLEQENIADLLRQVSRTGQLLHGLERALRRRANLNLSSLLLLGVSTISAVWVLAAA